MTTIENFQVKKDNPAETRLVERELVELGEGEIIVRIDRFAVTANNVTYAVVGEKLGYWKFFPADDEAWGIVPAWGLATVETSNHEGVGVGERLYGFFPMASHLIMAPGKVEATRLVDAAPRRADLPPVYNVYRRLSREIGYDGDMDNERMALYPLYATSYCLYDFLKDKDWFGADRVILTSASSKTAIGTAYAVKGDNAPPRLVGLTSAPRVEAVEALGLYEEVAPYDAIDNLNPDIPTAIVDMAGNGGILGALHKRLGEAMKYTANVGVTHYNDNEMGPDFIRERSEMFFAPGHIQKRRKDWGPGEFEKRAEMFWHQAALKSRAWLGIREAQGADAVAAAWGEAVAGEVPADAAWVVGFLKNS